MWANKFTGGSEMINCIIGETIYNEEGE